MKSKNTKQKTIGIYYMDNQKKILYLRLRTILSKDNSITRIISFVPDFYDASKFINTNSAKKQIQSIQSKYPSVTLKYITSDKS